MYYIFNTTTNIVMQFNNEIYESILEKILLIITETQHLNKIKIEQYEQTILRLTEENTRLKKTNSTIMNFAQNIHFTLQHFYDYAKFTQMILYVIVLLTLFTIVTK